MVFWHNFLVGLRSLFWWALAVVALVLIHIAFYPSIAENADVWRDISKSLPEALKGFVGADYVSPRGFLQAEFFGSAGFVMLLIFFVARGSAAIAGDEDKGRSELALAAPVSRQSYLSQRFLVLLAESFVLFVVMSLSLFLLGPLFDINPGIVPLLAGSGSVVLGALVFGMGALFFGAATGSHAVSLALGSALAVLFTLYTLLSPAADFFDDVQFVSPAWQAFAYAPVVSGARLGNLAILFAEVIFFFLLSLIFYTRRDLR